MERAIWRRPEAVWLVSVASDRSHNTLNCQPGHTCCSRERKWGMNDSDRIKSQTSEDRPGESKE